MTEAGINEKPWLEYYDQGVPPSLAYPEMPLHGFLEAAARRHPEQTCTIYNGAELTYRQVNELVHRLAAGLADLGVRKGDRVGIFMPNIPQFVLAYFAILKIGAVVVAINPLYTSREVAYQVNDAGVEVLFVVSALLPRVKEIQPQTGLRMLIVTDLDEYAASQARPAGQAQPIGGNDLWLADLLASHSPKDRPIVTVTSNDVALFQYTGGTTGIAKGAIALHRNLVANTLQFRTWIGAVEAQETVLLAIPLYHVYGMVVGMCVAIAAAARMVLIPNPRDLPEVLASIQKYRATLYPGVPTLYNAINNYPEVGKYDLSSIRTCISGSAPLMQLTKQRFEALTGGKLVEGYGLSEAPTATYCNPLQGENPPGSIGLPLPDIEARIVSLEDGQTALEPGEIGELVVKGPTVMQGYHNQPEETAKALRQGWLYTGDIARMDEKGYFYLVDRKKDVIKPGGFQVWPREVEEVISAHPKVLEVAVAGVPDAYRGETVKAWVVVKPGEDLTEDEIREWCREKIAPFKIPTQVEFRTELPKTTVGKVLRRELVRQHKELDFH